MSSQQNQIIAECEKLHAQLLQRKERQTKTRIFRTQKTNFADSQNFLKNSKRKFDVKKFEQNILKQILEKHQKSSNKKALPNKNLSQRSVSHMNSFKHINIQRKLSQSKSKQKKDLNTNKLSKQKQIFEKSHLNNTKILRQKLLTNLNRFDDHEMINIQNSIPILNEARILKVLTSLEETKSKIQQGNLPEGRVKEQAKFIYFLWKMIDEQLITTRYLKQVIILLNQLNKNDLVDALCDLYGRQGQLVKMFVECWLKLKLDKFHYDLKQKTSYHNVNNSVKLHQKETKRQREEEKTVKKADRGKIPPKSTQRNENTWQSQQQFKDIKFLQPQQEKKLIQRLYEQRKDFVYRRQRMKTLNDQQKENSKFQKCTFKPLLTSSMRSKSSSRTHLLVKAINKESQEKDICQNSGNDQSMEISLSKVKGFEKAVKRMKNGQSQSKIKKQLLSYHSIGQNYQKIRQMPMNPPKFLSRQKAKKQELILFVIQFQIGRHKVKVKVHPTDTQKSVSKKLSKIYGLKTEQQQQIRKIISMELNSYYKRIGEQVSRQIIV